MGGSGARVRFDLPSGTPAAEEISEVTNTGPGQSIRYGKGDECPDDVRAAVYDAIKTAFGNNLNLWYLLPREVVYTPEYVAVTMVPVNSAYASEPDMEVQGGPRQRLLATLSEYHANGTDVVAVADVLANTMGDVATLRRELERLEQRGAVYQPTTGCYRRTEAGDD
jgi:hypothetical protein